MSRTTFIVSALDVESASCCFKLKYIVSSVNSSVFNRVMLQVRASSSAFCVSVSIAEPTQHCLVCVKTVSDNVGKILFGCYKIVFLVWHIIKIIIIIIIINKPMEFETFTDRALLFVANLICYFVPHCTLSLVLFHAIKYNNNNNNHDNVYGAVIMAEPLREFTRFI